MNQHDEGGAAHSVWRRRLLGADPLRQLRMRQQLTAFAALAATLAQTPRPWILLWLAYSLGLMLVFLLLIRSGWSQRLRDPSMTRLQMISALAAGAMAYPMAGELRMLALPMMMLILAFGMFELRGRVVTAMAWAGLAMLAAAMLFSHWVWPRRYTPAYVASVERFAQEDAVTLSLLAKLSQYFSQVRNQPDLRFDPNSL